MRTMTMLLLVGVAICTLDGQTRTVAAQDRASFHQDLADLLGRFHRRFDVYSDASAAGNHFSARACIHAGGVTCTVDGALPPMRESAACPLRPDAGTCIEAKARLRGRDWGGWYFLNGVLPDAAALPSNSVGKGVAPDLNFGSVPNAGIDLTGATELSFDVLGREGGERVEFFAFGAGWNPDTGQHAIDPDTGRPYEYPDSAKKASTGFVRLKNTWQHCHISLRDLTLSHTLAGFGWVAADNGNREITFYLDNISFDKSRLEEPRFPLSFDRTNSSPPLSVVLTNVSFSYDAAVALSAFVAADDFTNATLIADAFVAAQAHDRRFNDGRLRNGYQAGDLFLPPGWTPNGKTGTVRMPGWYDEQRAQWFEDRVQIGTDTGNMAWVMLGLLSYVEAYGARRPVESRKVYVDAIVKLATWIERNTRHPRSGYTGGVEGFDDQLEARTYRSTEHNIDLAAAFTRLATASGDNRWLSSAEYARAFVLSMFDMNEGKFWTGTKPAPDENAVNPMPVPLDVQSWSVLALGPRDEAYWSRAVQFAERHLRGGSGFSYSDGDTHAIWHEGTAQMAVAYRVMKNDGEATRLVSLLQAARRPSGLLDAANVDERGLATGFGWSYYRWPHTGATGWALLAERGVNPFAPAVAR